MPKHTHQHHRLLAARLANLLTALLAFVATAPQAQTVTDPTRPPASAMVSAPAEPADRNANGDSAARPPRPAAVPASAPQLQSIQRTTSGPANALVDGRLVRVGERIGDQTIVAIDSHGVQLRGGRGALQTLSLLSGVNKTPSLGNTEPAQAVAAAPRKTTP